MDTQVAQAFIVSAIDHWDDELGRKLSLVSTSRRTGEFRASDIIVTGLVTGDIEGHACLAVDENTARVGFSARHGRWPESIGDDVLELVGDLGKHLFAQASVLLSENDATCKVSYIGVSISGGKPVGRGGAHGDLIHLQGRRSSSGEADNIRIWISLAGDDGPAGDSPPEDEPAEAFAESEGEPRESATQRESASPPVADEYQMAAPGPAAGAGTDGTNGNLPDVLRARRFELVNEAGETRAVLSTVPDGSPYLILADAKGQIRVAIALSKTDAPRVMLLDELGGKIWEKP